MQDEKVSIITPMYNSERFISDSIKSVINQTYSKWEMLIIDDCSTDNSSLIVEDFRKRDDRIKYFRTSFPTGSPTMPRNIGIENAGGRFIAFLDSDDLWNSNKLEKQIKLFEDERVAIAYSNYEKVNEEGKNDNKIIIAPDSANYYSLLKGNIIACCTCIYDAKKIGKLFFKQQGHEDYALWLSILKQGFIAKNSGDILAKYRVRESSISSNKFRTIFWVYNIYRKNEGFSFVRSIYYCVITFSKSFIKYLK